MREVGRIVHQAFRECRQEFLLGERRKVAGYISGVFDIGFSFELYAE